MKPIFLFIASLLLLVCAGVSFNWTEPDRPILVEVLGAIGIFAWLPLLIIAIVWGRVRRKSRSSRLPEATAIAGQQGSGLVSTSVARSEGQVSKRNWRLFTPLRLFALGIVGWIAAFVVLEFGSSKDSGIQLAVLAVGSTTGLVATFTSVVWAIFKWRFGQGKRE